MRSFLTCLAVFLFSAAPSHAEPVLKIINFTADWCPNCQILNPRLDEAIEAFEPGAIERVDLDVTDMRGKTSLIERTALQTDVIVLAGEQQAA